MDTELTTRWSAVDPAVTARIPAARAQVHHALQLATSLGISFLPRKGDDSHTNLGWVHEHKALASRAVDAGGRAVSLALRVADLTMLVLRDGTPASAIPMHGASIANTANRIRAALSSTGLDASRYTLDRHYTIPDHPVANGGVFDASDREAFAQLALWYANADVVLRGVAASYRGEEVRLWPHHADIATLVRLGAGSTGAGLASGDEYYAEPYFYVNIYPAPRGPLPNSLEGQGHWHTRDWTGAVLPVTRVTSPEASNQELQVRTFLASALDATTAVLRG